MIYSTYIFSTMTYNEKSVKDLSVDKVSSVDRFKKSCNLPDIFNRTLFPNCIISILLSFDMTHTVWHMLWGIKLHGAYQRGQRRQQLGQLCTYSTQNMDLTITAYISSKDKYAISCRVITAVNVIRNIVKDGNGIILVCNTEKTDSAFAVWGGHTWCIKYNAWRLRYHWFAIEMG